MAGRGGMFWQSMFPAQWQTSTEQRQFLHHPDQLEHAVKPDAIQTIPKVIVALLADPSLIEFLCTDHPPDLQN